MKLHWMAFGAALAGLWSAPALAADSGPVKIALIADKTGPLEAYAKQTSAGFAMGLDYATGGTMEVAGHKLVVIEKDSQTKPDVGRNLLNEAYNDDGADIAVGGTSSAVALAMLPVAQDNKKIFVVEPAVADFDHRRQMEPLYLPHRPATPRRTRCRTRWPSASPARRSRRWRRTMRSAATFVAAFKTALAPTGAKLVFEEYAPPADDRLHRVASAHLRCARQGAGPQDHLSSTGPAAATRWRRSRPGARTVGHRDLDRRQHPAGAWPPTRTFPAWKAPPTTTIDIPKNPVNDWLVAENKKRFNGAPPDFFTCGGFIAAQAVVEALKKTGGSTDAEKLIAAMEGMAFDSPKGTVTFRKEDHQLLQPMYAFKIKVDPNVRLGDPRADARDHHGRDEDPDQEQALMSKRGSGTGARFVR